MGKEWENGNGLGGLAGLGGRGGTGRTGGPGRLVISFPVDNVKRELML